LPSDTDFESSPQKRSRENEKVNIVTAFPIMKTENDEIVEVAKYEEEDVEAFNNSFTEERISAPTVSISFSTEEEPSINHQ